MWKTLLRAPRAVVLVAAASIGAACLGTWILGNQAGAAEVPDWLVLRALARWDAGWYLSIARDGYWYRPGEQSPVAFFPAYPLAIRGLAALGLNRWLAAPLISVVCGVGAAFVFARWAQKVGGDARGGWATWLLILYPFSLYLYGVLYSDSLFLLAVAAAFLALEEDRPGLAGALGALATLARPVAPAVVLGLTVRSLERRWAKGESLRWRDWLPALSALGLAAWMLFLQIEVGDALAFAHVQGSPGWDQAPGLRTWLKFTWFEVLFPKVAPAVAARLIGHAVVTIAALALVWPTRRLLGVGYGVYVAVAVGLPALSSKDFQGLGRYCIAAFPLFLTLAAHLERVPRVRIGYLVASGALLLLLAFSFGAGGYVS